MRIRTASDAPTAIPAIWAAVNSFSLFGVGLVGMITGDVELGLVDGCPGVIVAVEITVVTVDVFSDLKLVREFVSRELVVVVK